MSSHHVLNLEGKYSRSPQAGWTSSTSCCLTRRVCRVVLWVTSSLKYFHVGAVKDFCGFGGRIPVGASKQTDGPSGQSALVLHTTRTLSIRSNPLQLSTFTSVPSSITFHHQIYQKSSPTTPPPQRSYCTGCIRKHRKRENPMKTYVICS